MKEALDDLVVKLLLSAQTMKVEYVSWCMDYHPEGIGSKSNTLVKNAFIPRSQEFVRLRSLLRQVRGLVIANRKKGDAVLSISKTAAAHTVAVLCSFHERWHACDHDWATLSQLLSGTGYYYRLPGISRGKVFESERLLRGASTLFALRGLLLENYYAADLRQEDLDAVRPSSKRGAIHLARELTEDLVPIVQARASYSRVLESRVVHRAIALADYLASLRCRKLDENVYLQNIIRPNRFRNNVQCSINEGPLFYPREPKRDLMALMKKSGSRSLKDNYDILPYERYFSFCQRNTRKSFKAFLAAAQDLEEKHSMVG